MGELPNGPVKIIVGAVIAAGLVAAFYHILPWGWFLFGCGLLAVEAWAFFNPYAHDTISEVIWALSERPLVPLIFGVGTGWAVTSGFIPATVEGLWVSLCVGCLLGHFFWQQEIDQSEDEVGE